MVENDWRVNQNGENHMGGLVPTGSPCLQTRLEQPHRPSTEQLYREAFQEHAPDALRGGRKTGGGSGEAGGVAAAVNELDESCRRFARSWPAQTGLPLAFCGHSEVSTYSLVGTYS
jgi:hypothetical protein